MLKIARESGEGQASATQIQELGDQRLNELNAQSERLQEQLQQFQDSTANRDDPARIALQQQIEQNQIDLRRADLEAAVRFCWRDTRADPPVSVTEMLAKEPQSKTCTACGRTYALTYTVIGWQKRVV